MRYNENKDVAALACSLFLVVVYAFVVSFFHISSMFSLPGAVVLIVVIAVVLFYFLD